MRQLPLITKALFKFLSLHTLWQEKTIPTKEYNYSSHLVAQDIYHVAVIIKKQCKPCHAITGQALSGGLRLFPARHIAQDHIFPFCQRLSHQSWLCLPRATKLLFPPQGHTLAHPMLCHAFSGAQLCLHELENTRQSQFRINTIDGSEIQHPKFTNYSARNLVADPDGFCTRTAPRLHIVHLVPLFKKKLPFSCVPFPPGTWKLHLLLAQSLATCLYYLIN